MIIGIAGKMGSGKSTLAEQIVKLTGKRFTIINFGDILKQEVANIFDINIDQLYTQKGKASFWRESRITLRDCLQWYGTEITRKQLPNYWVDAMKQHINKSSNTDFIIADCRFPNEIEMCDTRVKLNPYPELDISSTHESETALDNYNYFHYIINPNYGELPVYAKTLIKRLNL